MPLPSANVLQPLIDVFEQVLLFFHGLGVGWGMSIILMTVAVRAVLIPLTIKQFHSMQSLQRLGPEIKALQAKYKDDKQRQQQEMMKFYKENKVNPFGSCLPMVLQLPVFISLFYMLRKDLRLNICHQTAEVCGKVVGQEHSAKFLFIPDLTDHATGAVLVVLILLYVGSQLGSSLLMSTTIDKNQRRLMMFLPLIFVTFIFRFPAGLLVYWITTNLWTIGQQYMVKRTLGPAAPVVGGVGAGAATATAVVNPRKGGGGGGAAEDGGKPKASPNGGAPNAAAAPPSARRKKKRSGRRR
jgi:YidC/Oxa1 family membrane protein insertase